MGLLKKLKKGLKPLKSIAKIALKTAPLWSSFIPGGSIATGLLSKAGKFGAIAGKVSKVAKPALTAAKRLQAFKTAPKGPPTYPSTWARQSVQQAPNGVAGRMGTLHSRAIARMRATRPAPKGTRAGYLRAQRLQARPTTGMGQRRMFSRIAR